jgi:hypothetical protein
MPRLVRCVALLAVGGLAAFLSGCTGGKTTPATNVTATSATLWASVTANPNDYGEYWWEYSSDNGNTWTPTAHHQYGTPNANCTSNSGSEAGPLNISQDVNGLNPSTRYIYRFAATLCGYGPFRFDSTDASGTNYSSFTTESQVLRQDDATNPDPQALWSPDAGADDCYSDFDSFQTVGSGAYDGGPYRHIVVYDGECDSQNVDTERAELGYNSWRGDGDLPPNPDPLQRAPNLRTFWLFTEGDTLVTDWWVRLPSDFPISTDEFQTIEQEKQAAPNTSDLSSSVLAVEARQNQIQLSYKGGLQGPDIPIALPAPPLGTWFHLQLTAHYTQSREDGGVTLCVNGQCGIASNIQTLATFDNDGVSPYEPGDSVPSHIRLGIYHRESLPPTSMDVADFTVRTP